MRYMQINRGEKLHLVYEAGEGRDLQHSTPRNELSAPLCGRGLRNDGGFRMTVNVPFGLACKRCMRVYAARHRSKGK